ncbi:MAG: hypothetical protein NWF06_03205 [Candidatus Bathyarchaeota archaeon]|nr:hypothetical protein [Candidatus Bathyarchaeum sp.]
MGDKAVETPFMLLLFNCAFVLLVKTQSTYRFNKQSEAEANCFGGVSPPSSEGGTKREQMEKMEIFPIKRRKEND